MSRRSSPPLWLYFLIIAPIAACDCGSEPPTTGCMTDDECMEGQICIDLMCVDAPPPMDSGMGDAGPPPAMCDDVDRDGHFAIDDDCDESPADDCDDGNASVHPGAPEVCGDGIDNDCDGMTDEPDCECVRGDRVVCYEAEADTAGVGMCRRGIAVCESPGMLGECRGQALPGEETCDHTDEDCDGLVDEGLRNACGECGEELTEMCGNNLDDDCDGLVDEDCDCDYRCECMDATSCECTAPTNQPCYDGPFVSRGQGICAGGRRDCVENAGGEQRWDMCEGQVLPGEECAGGVANGLDDDCDGIIDDGCRDADEDGSPFPADCDDNNADVNPDAAEICNGRDDNCNGVADEGVTNACGGCGEPAATEECGNGLDDNCDGRVDEGCSCMEGDMLTCYGGPDGTQGVGACLAGVAVCSGGAEFSDWGECAGQVIPLPEICNGIDDDCDGEEDERWATGSNDCGFCDGTEICDGMDNDCDGLVDEGVSNACGECGEEPIEVCDGLDNDCDGVIDDGVTNACGTCAPMPCYVEGWTDLSNCEIEGRTCDDVEEDPDFPGSVTLGTSTLDFDYIYLAVTDRNQVAQIDTRTGVKNWQVASHGRWPSRTAVAGDGSVWVSNRAYTGSNPADVNQSNVVHLNASDGSLICRAPVVNVARSLAIDRNGDIWAGSFNGGHLWHISGSMVDDTTSPPSCVVLNEIETGVNIYGLAADADGYIWTASSGAGGTIRVDIATYATQRFDNPAHYGIAADGRNQLWFGGLGHRIHAINRTTGALLDTASGRVSGVTVHPNGNVYASAYYDNRLVAVDGETGAVLCRSAALNDATQGRQPHGVAVDRMGRIWMPSRNGGGFVNVFDTDCNLVATYTVDAGRQLYSYSDMTGHLLRTFVSPQGNWHQIFDSGYGGAYWSSVDWMSIEPAGTDIIMTMYTSDTVAGLDAGVTCGPFNTSPADLSGCPAGFQNHRYIRVEAQLTRIGTDARPILQSVNAHWAY